MVALVIVVVVVLASVVLLLPHLSGSQGSGQASGMASVLNTQIGGQWSVIRQESFYVSVSDFSATLTYLNGTSLTFHTPSGFLRYLFYHLTPIQRRALSQGELGSFLDQFLTNISSLREYTFVSEEGGARGLAVYVQINVNPTSMLGQQMSQSPLPQGMNETNGVYWEAETFDLMTNQFPALGSQGYLTAVIFIKPNNYLFSAMTVITQRPLSQGQLDGLVNQESGLI
uniref:Uncharacterized protein n=1 Tax=Metallosphaera hakonensis JCM 8857 = DSM 7519 TaxID=1293036 RepID=A0A2U9IRG3_9CREN